MARTLTELFALGMFENPYRDPDEAARIVATPAIGKPPRMPIAAAWCC